VDPLIEECPALKAKIANPRSRDSGNTQLMKEFPNGLLVMTGANSSVGLRSLPAQFLFMDEVDAYPGDVDGEGDPINLAEARTRTFSRRKIFLVSTPTIEGESRIDSAYLDSDQRKYHLPCPHCQEKQVLKWEQVKWPKDHPELAAYECEHCKKKIEEHHKTWMLANGVWIATNPNTDGKTAGFHLSSLYSPLGWFSWKEAASLWMRSHKKSSFLRTFINTYLGEAWREKGDVPDWEMLYKRRETYRINTLPDGVLFLTAGCDIQKSAIHMEIVGWGEDKQSWSIDYITLPGDPNTDEPWKALDQIISSTWKLSNGIEIPLSMTAIDSGAYTHLVYSYVRSQSASRVMAVDGRDANHYVLGQPKMVEVNHRGKRFSRGVRLWPVGTSMVKTELYAFLKQLPPNPGEAFPSGYCHFPSAYDPEYFKQLTAEQLIARTHRGYIKYLYEQTRKDNHALDARVYARAAAASVGLDRLTEKDFSHMKKDLGLPHHRTEKKTVTQSSMTAYEMI
jgi:phage terminase large subunit GpA-like protein